ncbi:MAG TPA: tetratricopeptide repeat protein [Pyrinomonadaceae bacterium]|nr:tetratricopeptide repeat protein [Pyrinomonadaceae bacterium]
MSTTCLKTVIVILLLTLIARGQTSSSTNLADFEDLALTLTTLSSSQEREQLMTQKKELLTPDLRKALIRQGNAQLTAGRYAKAFDIYGIARNVAEKIGDKEGVAAASLDIGTVYYFQANYPAALEHYQRARELFTEVTNNYESAKALSGVALIYREQRRDSDALAALQQALKEFTSLGDKEEIANTLNSIGAIYYGQGNYTGAAEAFRKSGEANSGADALVRLADSLYMQGDYSQALVYYKQSLERVHEIGAVVASLNGAANSAYYQGNYEEALKFYERNLSVQKTLPDKEGLASSLKGIGNVHRSRGDYGAALENYFNSLKTSEEAKAPVGTILGSIGLVRALQGDYPRALEYYNKALKEFETNSNKLDMARTLSLIGNVQYTQGNYDSALESYRRALSLREEMDDKSGQGDVLAGIGSTLVRQKNYSDGLDTYQKALTLFNSIGQKSNVAEVLTRVAEAFFFQGDYQKSLSAAESAVTIARQTDEPSLLWYARLLTGKAQHKLESGAQAYQSLTDAVSIIESLRSRPAIPSGVEHNRVLPYLSLIDVLLDQHRPGEAFDYAERAKVQANLDVLRNSTAMPSKGLTQAERDEERRMAGEVASLELQLERESQLRTSTEARRGNLRDRLNKARIAYANLKQQLFAAYPRLKIDRGELAPLKLNEMRALLVDTSTALLEYAITENNTYLFVLTADRSSARARPARAVTLNLKVYPLEIRNEQLTSKVRQFETQLATKAVDFEQSARDLYELLIRPADDQLGLKTKLVIVPDGVLWRLPFEALQPQQDHYVIDQMQVSYAPSLTALREMRKQRSRAMPNGILVGFANPAVTTTSTNRIKLAFSDLNLDLSSQQEEELQRVATAYASSKQRLYAGNDASEDRLRTEVSQADVLHFATPMLLDETAPLSSFITLAANSGDRSDGFLQLREIMSLQTPAQLVVISDVARHDVSQGAASSTLSWSWFVAGSPATMLNRWPVESAARSKLLTQFYSAMITRRSVANSKTASLRRSLLVLRRSPEYQHPHYWASFALIGNER